MKVDDNLLIKNLAMTAQLVNGINGGMAQPHIRLEKSDSRWVQRMKVPGVSIDNISIEVKDGFLFVSQNLFVQESAMEIPYIIEMLNLNSQIDQEKIYAEYSNGQIIIHMPFDELASGFERDIEIVRR